MAQTVADSGPRIELRADDVFEEVEMEIARGFVGVVWILAIGSFFVATESAAAGLGRLVFWVLVVVHAIECGVFLPRLRNAPGPLTTHLFRTFLFGFLHVGSLAPRAGDETPS
jgi:uncharacterized protein YhhL (DUF1145 family)